MNIITDIFSTSDRKIVVGFVKNCGMSLGQIRFSVTEDKIICLESTMIPSDQHEDYIELYKATLDYAKGVQILMKNEIWNNEPEPVSVSIMHDRDGQSFEDIASFVDKARIMSLGKPDSEIVMVLDDDMSDHEVAYFKIKNPEKVEDDEYQKYLALKERFESR